MMLSEWIRVFFEAVEGKGEDHYSTVAAARHIAQEIKDKGLRLPCWGAIEHVGQGGGSIVCEVEEAFLSVSDFVAILDFEQVLSDVEAITTST